MPHLSLWTTHHFPSLLPPHRLLPSQTMPPRQLRQPLASLRLSTVNHRLWRVCRDLVGQKPQTSVREHRGTGLSTSILSDEIEALGLKWVVPRRQISLSIC
ncbi:arginine and glutamate-rich protein 1-like [Pyrus ussuriensis x Pyrus communis]|uniref:Arginine and glutamate-rich protein 1-like n=1 Tax=Pyrus ussuriensis x Pyrus communis TaxID=2448454 RepID=A0A5N5H2S3_9ROSA|nr:arginine and glutamate-rich protein 1-like [Pyrus ussuriensis x Pyrus communis]